MSITRNDGKSPISRIELAAVIFLGVLALLFIGLCAPKILGLRYHDTYNAPAWMLRNINSAQAVYQSGTGNGNFAPGLADLGGSSPNEIGLIDSTVVNAQTTPKSGYLLGEMKTTPRTATSPARYSITAFPATSTGVNRTGNDCYYVDETGIVRHSGRPDVPATAASPPFPFEEKK